MSKYVVLSEYSNQEYEVFNTKAEAEAYLTEKVSDEYDDTIEYMKVYELGSELSFEVKPRTVVVKDVKVTTKKRAVKG